MKDIAHPKELLKKENNEDLLSKLKIWQEKLEIYKLDLIDVNYFKISFNLQLIENTTDLTLDIKEKCETESYKWVNFNFNVI